MRGVAVALAAALLAGCAAGVPRPPEVQTGPYSNTLVFPIIDVREDRDTAIADCKPDRPSVSSLRFDSALSRVWFAVDKGVVADVARQDLEQKNAERLKQLPNGGAHYATFIYLDTFAARLTTFDYRMTAYIVRADTGEVVWSHAYFPSTLRRWQGLVGGPLNKLVREVNYGGISMPLCQAFRSITADTFTDVPRLPAY